MTAVQIAALVCLPLVWALVANGPSRSAMRRMRRNARRGGLPADVAFDQWMRRHGRCRETGDLLRSASRDDQAAFALVAAAAAEIDAASLKGETFTQAKARVAAERYPIWVERSGPTMACRAADMLERCGPSAVMVPGELARAALSQ